MELISPSTKYKDSYSEMVQDFIANEDDLTPFTLKEDFSDFPSLVQRLEGYSQGLGIHNDFVAHRSFWLLDANKRIVGTSNLRLSLNEGLKNIGGHIGFGVRPSERNKGYASKILAETLRHAKQYGIDNVLLSCDKDNTASAKVIQKNGGVLEFEGTVSGIENTIQRYCIKL